MTRPLRIDTCERYRVVHDAATSCRSDVLVVAGAPGALSLLRRALDQIARRCLIVYVQQRPSCVVMDLDALGSAFDVCETIRASPEATDTIIMLMTAQRSVRMFDAALVAGADEILIKPVPNTELLARVEAALTQDIHSSPERRARCQRLREQRAALEAAEMPCAALAVG